MGNSGMKLGNKEMKMGNSGMKLGNKEMKKSLVLVGCLIFVSGFLGCNKQTSQQNGGKIMIDGSSTVAPITAAIAEMFQKKSPQIRVAVGISGTGGGFKKFLDSRADLRTDLNDASRPISASEIKLAAERGVEFVEIPVAIDGICVVVNPANDFCDGLTISELKAIWQPGSEIKNWSQVRQGFPDLTLELFAPGTDSGTFDYFTEAIVGKAHTSRSDYTASAYPPVLVQGVQGDKGTLGYFGYAYYQSNKEKLKLLAIDNGNGKGIKPSSATILAGKYMPLSRPLFLYVNKASLKKQSVQKFLAFYLQNAAKTVQLPSIGYVPLSQGVYDIAQMRIDRMVTGSAMASEKAKQTKDLAEIFAVEP